MLLSGELTGEWIILKQRVDATVQTVKISNSKLPAHENIHSESLKEVKVE